MYSTDLPRCYHRFCHSNLVSPASCIPRTVDDLPLPVVSESSFECLHLPLTQVHLHLTDLTEGFTYCHRRPQKCFLIDEMMYHIEAYCVFLVYQPAWMLCPSPHPYCFRRSQKYVEG